MIASRVLLTLLAIAHVNFAQQKEVAPASTTKTPKFHFSKNEKYALHLDVLSHLTASTLLAQSTGETFSLFTNRKTAAIIGASISFTATQLIEIRDGSSRVGFSKKDALINTLGALWGGYTITHPNTANYIELKVSAHPRELHTWLRNDFSASYKQHEYWLCIKGTPFYKKLSWLGLGIGVKMRGSKKEKHLAWLIGLDINLLQKLPGPLKILNAYRPPFLPKKKI